MERSNCEYSVAHSSVGDTSAGTAYAEPPWSSCAKRGVIAIQCIHGFINNVSGGKLAPNGMPIKPLVVS